MANVLVDENSLRDIASAIREKNGTYATYKPNEMGDAIRGIEVSGGEEILFTNHGTMYKKNMVILTDNTDGFYQYAYRYADKMETVEAPLLQANWASPHYVFQGCTALKTAKLPRIRKLGSFVFGDCIALETLILGEEQYPMQGIEINTLANCTALKNIKYIGIINKSANLQWCTLLTHESLMYLINALEDKSADTSGTTWTLTIGSENLAKLDETTELAIAWQKGWVVV